MKQIIIIILIVLINTELLAQVYEYKNIKGIKEIGVNYTALNYTSKDTKLFNLSYTTILDFKNSIKYSFNYSEKEDDHDLNNEYYLKIGYGLYLFDLLNNTFRFYNSINLGAYKNHDKVYNHDKTGFLYGYNTEVESEFYILTRLMVNIATGINLNMQQKITTSKYIRVGIKVVL